MSPFVHRLRVRYAETDMQAVVFNAHYVTWMDVAHTELWRAALGPLADFNATGYDFVVAEVNVRYRASARFDQEIDVAVELAPLTTTSMTSTYAMTHEGTLLAEGTVRHVCVDRATFAKAPWPDDVREKLVPYVRAG